MSHRGGWWLGRTLTARAVLVTCLVALISVLMTALVALPLAVRSANEERRVVLAGMARVAANAIEVGTPSGGQRADRRAERVAATLRGQGIDVVLIRDGRPDQAGLPPRVVGLIAHNESVSQRVVFHGRVMLAEGRSAGGAGDGIVLLQPGAGITARTVINRLWLALTAGLLAGVVAGVLLGRRLARPLRAVAAAARRLCAGDRAAPAPIAAPTEVAEVSSALNELAAALTTSENRQRAFLMSVSHELRTPLTAIKGYAEALADGVVGPDGARRAAQTMLAESARLDRLIEDLLALARLEADDFPLEIADVELGSLVALAAEAWGGRCAEAGVVLCTELPRQPVTVPTDPGRVRQVVDGLMENALRVAPAGAPVVLAVRPAGGAGRVRPAAELEVRDGGPGFTDDDLAVVFERGILNQRYRGVRRVGSGIGLALVARLVRRLGGSIEVGHAAEGGARFTASLPGSDRRASDRLTEPEHGVDQSRPGSGQTSGWAIEGGDT